MGSSQLTFTETTFSKAKTKETHKDGSCHGDRIRGGGDVKDTQLSQGCQAFDREKEESTDQLVPGRAEGPDGVCPADGGGEHLEAGEGGRAGADGEPLEEAEEAADVELEPGPRPGQVPCRLHHLCHRSESQPGLLWGRHLHRVEADGPPWAQAQHHRELQGRPPQCQGARAEGAKAHEGLISRLGLWILFGQGFNSLTTASSPDQPCTLTTKPCLEAFLIKRSDTSSQFHLFYRYGGKDDPDKMFTF